MENLNSWASAGILFLSQLALNWIRAVNIEHITKKSFGKGLVSTNLLAGIYLITTAVGIHSVYTMDVIPLVGYFLGCSLGYWMAIRK